MTPALAPDPRRRRCLLSNGRYSVMHGACGTGWSRWGGMAVTRWREDPVALPWGSFLLLRDEHSAVTWSATVRPHGIATDDDVADFAPGCARFSRTAETVRSVLDVAVAADADVELRRLTLTNRGGETRTLTVTSFAELVLGPDAADRAHPAFSKMFVQTEWDEAHGMLLATRRRRDDSEAEVWAAQLMRVDGDAQIAAHETDRLRFLGRGRGVCNAAAMQPGAALSGTVGSVLDPVFALRQRVSIEPGASVTVLLWTQLADSRDGARALADRPLDGAAADALFAEAARHALDEHAKLGIDAAQAAQFASWLGALLVNDPAQRTAPASIARAGGGPPTLWAAGISGDRPILLLALDAQASLALADTVLLAQRFWQRQRQAVDVVFLVTARGDEANARQAMLQQRAATQKVQLETDTDVTTGAVFVLREDAIDANLRDGLFAAARVVLGTSPSPEETLVPEPAEAPPRLRAHLPAGKGTEPPALELPNGTGGFVDGGRSYRIELDDGQTTPMPWCNVIANPDFGCLVSADGGGYAWSLNSQQNPLTPWPNDPVSDAPHQVIYLRDDDSGALWSACALPIRVGGARYATTHGKGWTRFEHDAHGIDLELMHCVAVDDPVLLSRLRLCNRGAATRHLSITGYVEWALGANGSTPAPFVVTSRDASTGAVLARNRWRADFGDRVAFFDLGGKQHSASGSRADFLGALGTLDCPSALAHDAPLNGRFGAGIDPCGALQTRIELPPGSAIELVLVLGDAASEDEARQLVERYRATTVDDVLAAVAAQWDEVLGAVQVRTPDRAMDILLNDWLLYQVLSCRLWARTAYYQASGAFGFRDQLQDVMALCVARPDLAREHLLRAAGRQFVEGDVQHWWLPPKGQGIRTRISDDRIWLVYVAMHYVDVSGDVAVLDERLRFLAGEQIAEGKTDAFFQPTTSDRDASVYEHCALAIDSSLAVGAHGLPLIGTGDWNDGMNSVGDQGRGESTWLAWFLIASIAAFAPHAERRGEHDRAQRWRDHAEHLREALAQAWDGRWYRRGYYDDGAPLGSAGSDECRIDTIAQSWSVMAGMPDPARSAAAMGSVDELLVDPRHQLSRLFTPPFDHGRENPGYIKGYPPGVRENGGQYTHGAIWSVFAWAGLGDGDRAGGTFRLLNPLHHASDAAAVERYKVEPYVACADVYAGGALAGRGGWTWYSGSAAWLYRAGLEVVLGFQLHGSRLRMNPCIPADWSGFELRYRHRGARHVSVYTIEVENPQRCGHGVSAIALDGVSCAPGNAVDLLDDGKAHVLRIVLG